MKRRTLGISIMHINEVIWNNNNISTLIFLDKLDELIRLNIELGDNVNALMQINYKLKEAESEYMENYN